MQYAPDSAGSAAGERRFSAAVAAVTSAFGDPTRREIYLYVRSHPGVTASEVAAEFSVHPNVARHHLDRLTSGGYLDVSLERPPSAGAGRPSKRFRAADGPGGDPTLDFVMHRDDLLVALLAQALELLGPSEAERLYEVRIKNGETIKDDSNNEEKIQEGGKNNPPTIIYTT